MNDNISDKDKKDWDDFLQSDEKLEDKDFKETKKKRSDKLGDQLGDQYINTTFNIYLEEISTSSKLRFNIYFQNLLRVVLCLLMVLL